jgi:hypothetical protein
VTVLNPDLPPLMRACENDLSNFKFGKVYEFEAFIDNLMLYIYQAYDNLINNKIKVMKKARDNLEDLCIDVFIEAMKMMDREQKLTFIAKNEI